MASLAVVGDGAGATSLAAALIEAGFTVHRYDPMRDHADAAQRSDPSSLASADAFIISASTQARDGISDLSSLVETCTMVASVLERGRLVVVESAPFPGVTENVVAPILSSTGCVPGRDFLLACAPARASDGSPGTDPRVVGGVTPEATGVAALLYSQFSGAVKAVSSARTAEIAKLLDDAYHNVNTALVNELAVVCHDAGIDVWEVLDAAPPDRFGFTPFQSPAPMAGQRGATGYDGGNELRRSGYRGLRLVEQALEINAEMPAYVASRIADALNETRKPVKGAQILILGISENLESDLEATPAFRVMSGLARRGARLSFHDAQVEALTVAGARLERTVLTERTVESADCVVLLAGRDGYDLGWLKEYAQLLFDARNVLGPDRGRGVVRL